jgi:hypothetical protein
VEVWKYGSVGVAEIFFSYFLIRRRKVLLLGKLYKAKNPSIEGFFLRGKKGGLSETGIER